MIREGEKVVFIMRDELDKSVSNPSEIWFQESGNTNTFRNVDCLSFILPRELCHQSEQQITVFSFHEYIINMLKVDEKTDDIFWIFVYIVIVECMNGEMGFPKLKNKYGMNAVCRIDQSWQPITLK